MTHRQYLVGLISDTHGLVRPQIREVFSGVDLIVHAGDVGGQHVLDTLATIAPVEAVSGNVDDRFNPSLARQRSLPVGALTLHVSHGDELGRPTPALLLAKYAGDILVFGHTHNPVVFRSGDGRLVVNPGAAGPRRFKSQPTVAKLTVVESIATVDLISLD